MRPDNNRVITGAAAACLLAAFGVSLCVGRYPLGFSDILGALSSAEGMAAQVFWRLRLPRSAACLLAGMAMGLSGAVYQLVFANPLAAPDVMGVCCDFAQMIDDKTAFYPAFGNNETRMSWLHRLMESGCNVPTIIHPTAYVSPTARVMPGTVALPYAIVNTGCEIKAGCIVNCGAIIDHGCVLEEGVHVCLGAIVKAENRIPRCMKIEAGEVVQNRTYPL